MQVVEHELIMTSTAPLVATSENSTCVALNVYVFTHVNADHCVAIDLCLPSAIQCPFKQLCLPSYSKTGIDNCHSHKYGACMNHVPSVLFYSIIGRDK